MVKALTTLINKKSLTKLVLRKSSHKIYPHAYMAYHLANFYTSTSHYASFSSSRAFMDRNSPETKQVRQHCFEK